MKSDRDPPPLPPRLITGEGAEGELLRRYVRARSSPDAGTAWQRLVPRLGRPDKGARLRLGLLAATAGALAGAVAVSLWHDRPAPPVALVMAPAAPAVVAPAPVTSPPRLRVPLGPQPSALPVGALDLGPIKAVLGATTIARGRTGRTGLELELLAGRLGLEVPRDEPVAVVMGVYRFTVAGAVFALEDEAGKVRLSVETGQVAVHRGRSHTRLALVGGGQTWSGQAAPPPASDLGAEIAAYRRAQSLTESAPERALTAFVATRRRFPRGGLRAEIDLSIVELLPRLGRYQEALAESAALLARGAPGPRRASELHLLRGNIYRDGLRDLSRARAEYERAAAGSGPAADEARALLIGSGAR